MYEHSVPEYGFKLKVCFIDGGQIGCVPQLTLMPLLPYFFSLNSFSVSSEGIPSLFSFGLLFLFNIIHDTPQQFNSKQALFSFHMSNRVNKDVLVRVLTSQITCTTALMGIKHRCKEKHAQTLLCRPNETPVSSAATQTSYERKGGGMGREGWDKTSVSSSQREILTKFNSRGWRTYERRPRITSSSTSSASSLGKITQER